jgi:hypothetical protein
LTVVVSCNLSDGFVLAVDSATTVPAIGGGVAKVYENAEKLFQLDDRPIGVATYGLGALGNRSIGSYLREFEARDPGGVVTAHNDLGEVVEALREFFFTYYQQTVVPLAG